MENKSSSNLDISKAPVSKKELNSWKRGFTPQAEIWNGRMAVVGIAIALSALILSNLNFGN